MSSCETVDLVGYLEGALDAEDSRVVEDHLLGCERCRNSMEELGETAEWLVELWSAAGESCPPAEAIAEYVSGEGEDSARKALGRHVERCPSCRELLETLRALEAEWVPPEEGPELPESIRGKLPFLAQGALAERLRRAAEAAVGEGEALEGEEMAEWLKRILEPRPEAWPQAALPSDAAEIEEEEETEP